MNIAYAMSSAILKMALSWISIFVHFRTTWNMRIMQAGPEQNAEARNRGARIEAFQKGRAARPL